MASLDESTEAFIGRSLTVRPFHGYGWTEARYVGGQYVHESVPPPAAFSLRLTRLWSYEDDTRRGGVGRVESPGHPLDGFWLIFSTRHVGQFNFTDRAGHYNVDLSSVEPTEDQNGWPRTPKDTPSPVAYQGWANIGA